MIYKITIKEIIHNFKFIPFAIYLNKVYILHINQIKFGCTNLKTSDIDIYKEMVAFVNEKK